MQDLTAATPEVMRQHIMCLIAELSTPDAMIDLRSCDRPARARACAEVDLLQIAPIKSAISYATALHEIGHFRERHQRSRDLMVVERWAWWWAKENALLWTPVMERLENSRRHPPGTSVSPDAFGKFSKRFTPPPRPAPGFLATLEILDGQPGVFSHFRLSSRSCRRASAVIIPIARGGARALLDSVKSALALRPNVAANPNLTRVRPSHRYCLVDILVFVGAPFIWMSDNVAWYIRREASINFDSMVVTRDVERLVVKQGAMTRALCTLEIFDDAITSICERLALFT
jgi:hypothetical protein